MWWWIKPLNPLDQGHANKGNDHQWSNVLIFDQILPTSNIRSIRRIVRRIWMLILGFRGLTALFKPSCYMPKRLFSIQSDSKFYADKRWVKKNNLDTTFWFLSRHYSRDASKGSFEAIHPGNVADVASKLRDRAEHTVSQRIPQVDRTPPWRASWLLHQVQLAPWGVPIVGYSGRFHPKGMHF